MSYCEEPEYAPPGPKAVLNVTLESFDTSHFYDDVVQKAVNQLIGQRSSEVQKAFNAKVQEAIDAKVTALLEQAIDELIDRPIQKFDSLGVPQGEPVTFRKVLVDGANVWLAQKVKQDGSLATSHYDTGKTRVDWLIEKHVIAGLQKEMTEEVAKVREGVKKRATEAVAAVLTSVRT